MCRKYNPMTYTCCVAVLACRWAYDFAAHSLCMYSATPEMLTSSKRVWQDFLGSAASQRRKTCATAILSCRQW